MSTQAKHKLEVPAMPPPPKLSGFTCLETKRGREVRGGDAHFLVTPDALVVSWSTVWTGAQRKSVPRGDVRAVKVYHDPTSSISRHMTKLVIEYGDGQSLDPVRRRPAAETKWLAERVREALGHERPKWAAKPQPEQPRVDYEVTREEVEVTAPPPTAPVPAPAPPAERAPLAPPSPVPVAPVAPTESPVAAPPRGARNVRAAWRRGRLVVRAGPLNPLSSPREKTAAGILLGTVSFAAGVGSYVATAYNGGPVPPPLLLFAAIGAVVCGMLVWGATSVLIEGSASHVFVFSRQSLRVATVGRRGRPKRFPPVWREDISDVRAGDANDPNNPSAELHAYLRDGERVGFMAGRSRLELDWIGWHLSQALPKLPPLPKPQWARSPVVAQGGVPVLPYGRDTASADISIHTFQDGGVAVSIPPTHGQKWSLLAPVGFLILFAMFMWGRFGGFPFPGLAGVVVMFLALVAVVWLAREGLWLVRWGQPLVVGVDPTSLYVDDPLSLRRLRRWPRHWVADVRLTTEQDGKGNKSRYVEILLTGQPPLKLCQDRGDWDRKRVAAVLRRAAGLPGPPPEHVKEAAGRKSRPAPAPVYRSRPGRTHSARRAV